MILKVFVVIEYIQMLYCCKVSCFGEVTYDCSLLCRGSLVVGVAVVKTCRNEVHTDIWSIRD